MIYSNDGKPYTIGPGTKIVLQCDINLVQFTDEHSLNLREEPTARKNFEIYPVRGYAAFTSLVNAIAKMANCLPKVVRDDTTIVFELVSDNEQVPTEPRVRRRR